MIKTHYAINNRPACGRGKRITTDIRRVDCRSCQKDGAVVTAMATAAAEQTAEFLAQKPKKVAEPWKKGTMVCSDCGHDLFRYGGRSCGGHYSEHICANCGHSESRLTETGMSF